MINKYRRKSPPPHSFYFTWERDNCPGSFINLRLFKIEMELRIRPADLNRWKKNSVKIALELKYDLQIVSHIEKNLKFNIWDELPQQSKQIWFGWTHDDPDDIKHPQV